MALPISMAEEVAIFAARRALASGAINRAFVEVLHRLCQSDRAAIRNHAVLLAHQAAAIEWTRRQNGSAA